MNQLDVQLLRSQLQGVQKALSNPNTSDDELKDHWKSLGEKMGMVNALHPDGTKLPFLVLTTFVLIPPSLLLELVRWLFPFRALQRWVRKTNARLAMWVILKNLRSMGIDI
jgi:hypothetical protein